MEGVLRNDARWMRVRLKILGVAMGMSLGALMFKAFQLQIGQGNKLRQLAFEQYSLKVSLPPHRGFVQDRAGAVLAQSVQVDSVYADPTRLSDPRQAALALARVLHLDAHEERALEHRFDPALQFAWVKRQVSDAEALGVRALGLPGIGTVKESRRFYPQKELAAGLLGFAGIDGVGLEGLERAYDELLQGEPAQLPSVRDARGQMMAADLPSPVELTGDTLTLTLDRNLQYLAEQALARGLATTHAAAGVALILEPASGAVLAMATLPSFNPNLVADGERSAARNRALTDAFEPGSTLKAFMVAGALQHKVVTPQTLVFAENGALPVNDRVIHDHKPYGWLTVGQVLQVSSNIGAAKIGLSLGRERLWETLHAFGFGERTDLGLPGEVRGVLPPFHSDIATATASFGQGVMATPLQLVMGYGALANGGLLMRPFVVSRIAPADGTPAVDINPRALRQVVSPEITRQVTAMLERVVQKGGTAEAGAVPGYRVAGKTGTAQKVDPVSGTYSRDKRFSSFVGYLPAQAPRAVIGVFLDEPKGEVYGGMIAAPIFREIALGTMQELGVPPDAKLRGTSGGAARPPPASSEPPAGEDDDEPTPAPDSISPGTVPTVLGLSARRALRTLSAAGLGASLHGAGTVVGQRPSPGARFPADRAVSLFLSANPRPGPRETLLAERRHLARKELADGHGGSGRRCPRPSPPFRSPICASTRGEWERGISSLPCAEPATTGWPSARRPSHAGRWRSSRRKPPRPFPRRASSPFRTCGTRFPCAPRGSSITPTGACRCSASPAPTARRRRRCSCNPRLRRAAARRASSARWASASATNGGRRARPPLRRPSCTRSWRRWSSAGTRAARWRSPRTGSSSSGCPVCVSSRRGSAT
jgi:cell division protein FtsI (penicillin-binding protein 3)